MKRIPKAIYTKELRKEAVKLVKEGPSRSAFPLLRLENTVGITILKLYEQIIVRR